MRYREARPYKLAGEGIRRLVWPETRWLTFRWGCTFYHNGGIKRVVESGDVTAADMSGDDWVICSPINGEENKEQPNPPGNGGGPLVLPPGQVTPTVGAAPPLHVEITAGAQWNRLDVTPQGNVQRVFQTMHVRVWLDADAAAPSSKWPLNMTGTVVQDEGWLGFETLVLTGVLTAGGADLEFDVDVCVRASYYVTHFVIYKFCLHARAYHLPTGRMAENGNCPVGGGYGGGGYTA